MQNAMKIGEPRRAPARLDGARGSAAQRALALRAWARHGVAGDDVPRATRDAERDAARALDFDHRSDLLEIDLPERPVERRTLSGLIGDQGGHLVAPEFGDAVDVALQHYDSVRPVATVIRTEGAENFPYPTCNDVSAEGTLIIDGGTLDSSTDATYGTVNLRARSWTSGIVYVPNELLEDALPVFVNVLAGILGARIGRSRCRYATVGTGNAQPTGFLVGGTAGVTAVSATAIAADEVIKLENSVDAAHRVGASWQAHSDVIQALELLKDGQGRYLFTKATALGEPDRFRGRPVGYNRYMSSTLAAGNKVLAFGDFSKVVIRDVRTIRLQRMVETKIDLDQVGFVCFMRGDSAIVDAGTHPVKYLQMAAS